MRSASITTTPLAAPVGIPIPQPGHRRGERLLVELEAVLGPLRRAREVRTQHSGLQRTSRIRATAPESGPRRASKASSATGCAVGPASTCGADRGIVVLPPSLGDRWIRDKDDPLPPLWLVT